MGFIRRNFALLLRSKIAGPETDDLMRTVYAAPGPRWFTPGDPICRVHDDASMFLGGLRALLLQALHPLAMAGVAGHSGYRSDPWGRLQRTNHYIGTTTFGTAEAADRLVETINGIHGRVRGKAEDGRPYRANDPHLLAWVHAAEADSFLVAHQMFGTSPRLSDTEADTYVAQMASVAARLGVIDPPTTVAELKATIDSYRPELQSTQASRDTVTFLLDEPPLPWFARPGYAMLASGALASLPIWAREVLGEGYNGRSTATVDSIVRRPLGTVSTKVMHWAIEAPVVRHERRHQVMAKALADDASTRVE